MEGLNKEFIRDPEAFIRKYPLNVPARDHGSRMRAVIDPQQLPPIFDFDLQDSPEGVRLHPFEAHAKTDRFGTQRRISALWLDYVNGANRTIALTANADFLFTPSLSGCYIGVGNNNIVHIAGDVPGDKSTTGMRNKAAAALGGPATVGFDSNPAPDDEYTFIGWRDANGWSWWVQGHDLFYAVRSTVHTVAEIDDMSLG